MTYVSLDTSESLVFCEYFSDVIIFNIVSIMKQIE